MKYRVEFTDQAHAEADEAYEWIAGDSPANAARWYYRLQDRIQSLESFPKRYPLAPESDAFEQEIRQLLYGNYRILFIIEGKTVYVTHVRHGVRRYLTPQEDDQV